jgi:MFS family permease
VRTPDSDRRLVSCLILAALCGAIVSGFGTPLIPEVARVEDVSLEAAQWTLTMTLVVGAITTPIVSRLGDGRRRRHVLVGILAAVAFGGLVAAAIETFPGLLAGRALQGLGYGLIPLTIGVAREYLAGTVLRRTLALLSTSIALGVGLANPLTGLFVRYLDYRAAFLFGAALTAVAAVLTARVVPRSSVAPRRLGVDVPGALLLGGGLGAGLLAISRGGTWGWTSVTIVSLGLASVLLLALWTVVELRAATPLVDLRLACSPALLGVNLTALCTGAAVFGGMSLVYRVLQAPADAPGGLGQSLLVAGLLMTPMSVGSLLAPGLARRLTEWIRVRFVLAVGSALVAAAYLFFAWAHTTLWQVAVVTFVAGIGIGVAYSVMPALIVARTPPERTASATGVNTVLRITGGAIGSAMIAALQAAWTPRGEDFPAAAGYVVAALFAAGLCGISALVSVLLVQSAPPAAPPALAASADSEPALDRP